MKARHLICILMALWVSGCSVDKESMSMFLAKEICSCHFLVGQTEAYCRAAVQPSLLLGDIVIDEQAKQVTATSEEGTHPATFRFGSSAYGCELVASTQN